MIEDAGEISICCPFDHYTASGIPYKESNPSAHVNTTKELFHCKVCAKGFNQTQFIQKLYGCGVLHAKQIESCFCKPETIQEWRNTITLHENAKKTALQLGIDEKTIALLDIKSTPNTDDIAFPVTMYDQIVDIRKYTPNQIPKVRSRSKNPGGFILPFDLWRYTPENKMTIICAGEKDMAIAITHGFNAITFTGGEGVLPRTPECFRSRNIAICYDNDGAGIYGANKLAFYLSEFTPHIKIVTNFHEICKEKGEDITDFFMKYGKTREDLITYIDQTPVYTPAQPERISPPVVNLLTAATAENIGKIMYSNVQVVATSESTFTIPSSVSARKFDLAGDDTMSKDASETWELTADTAQDILHLMDNNFTEDIIKKNLRQILKVPFKERCVREDRIGKTTIFKAYVTDLFETSSLDTQPMEFTAYSIGQKLESGKKYLVTYKLVPHPYKGSQLTMVIIEAVQANDSVSNFVITPKVIANLDVIKNLNGTVEERVALCTEKVKGLLGYNGNNTLIQTIDLAYHTALQFNFGSFKNLRGYLDTIIISESRVGKSSTAETLRNTYGLGTFTSLAGNSATIPGLIGGSNKTAGGSFQTRAGIIPQNHRGLIIFEEFGKSSASIVTELTDIRSSNEVRITRVSGTITLPAMVRMIALTNVKNTNGTIKPIAAYPHGISIITELVEAAEDIARYDIILILADRGNNQIDPFWEPETPFDPEVYQTRVRWIWSRTPEQIIITKEVGLYIIEKANELNKLFECHIKIFGTEAWKKITRLAVAVAGYLVATNATYDQILVNREHVDYAVNYLHNIYDNGTFRLKEYVTHEQRYSKIDPEAIQNLQDIYNQHPGLILQLEQCASANKHMLSAATGLDNNDLNKALTRLTKGLFIRFTNHDIIPTERFRLGLAKINKNTHIRRVGE